MKTNWRITHRETAIIALALQNLSEFDTSEAFGFKNISSEEISDLAARFVSAANHVEENLINQPNTEKT